MPNPFLQAVPEMFLRIAGNTDTKQRPRFNAATKTVFKPASNIVTEADIRAVWREAGEPRLLDDVAIGIQMTIIVPRPKGHFKKNGELSVEGERNPIPRNKKPDVDNALKLVMDALNSRAYKDDVRVAKAEVSRIWGEWAETQIKLYTLH